MYLYVLYLHDFGTQEAYKKDIPTVLFLNDQINVVRLFMVIFYAGYVEYNSGAILKTLLCIIICALLKNHKF